MIMRRKFGPSKKINKSNLGKLPDKPGVYSIYTDGGNLQKIGRVKRHRADNRILESQKEIQDARRQAEKFSFIPTKSVDEAIELETRLIKSRKPPFNKEKKGK